MTEAAVDLVPLGWRNIASAQHLAAGIFPHEARMIFRNLVGSLLPRSLLPIVGGKGLASATYQVAIASGSQDRVVGLAGLYMLCDQPSVAWLGWYGVDARCRGRGLGRTILRATIDEARSRNHETLRLWTTANPTLTVAATELYRAFGFVRQCTDYVYYGHAVEIYSLAFKNAPTLLDPTKMPAVFVGAERRGLHRASRK